MAYQLVYTSAAKLLDAGRSGFGTVARSKAISPLVVSALERVSQFSNLRGNDRTRTIFVHRRIVAANNRFHLLSRICDAGADYTGRTQHIAHHLLVTRDEVARAAARGLTPADVLRQFAWLDRWDGAARFFSAADDVPLEMFQALGQRAARGEWARVTGNPALARTLAWDGAPRTGVLLVPRGAEPLALMAEALHEFGSQCWSRSFTTALETTDEMSDIDWVISSPDTFGEIQGRCGARSVFDLGQPQSLPLPPEPAPLVADRPVGAATRETDETYAPNPGNAADSASQQAAAARVRTRVGTATSPTSRASAPAAPARKHNSWLLATALTAVTLVLLGVIGSKLLPKPPEDPAQATSELNSEQLTAANKMVNDAKISPDVAKKIASDAGNNAAGWATFVIESNQLFQKLADPNLTQEKYAKLTWPSVPSPESIVGVDWTGDLVDVMRKLATATADNNDWIQHLRASHKSIVTIINSHALPAATPGNVASNLATTSINSDNFAKQVEENLFRHFADRRLDSILKTLKGGELAGLLLKDCWARDRYPDRYHLVTSKINLSLTRIREQKSTAEFAILFNEIDNCRAYFGNDYAGLKEVRALYENPENQLENLSPLSREKQELIRTSALVADSIKHDIRQPIPGGGNNAPASIPVGKTPDPVITAPAKQVILVSREQLKQGVPVKFLEALFKAYPGDTWKSQALLISLNEKSLDISKLLEVNGKEYFSKSAWDDNVNLHEPKLYKTGTISLDNDVITNAKCSCKVDGREWQAWIAVDSKNEAVLINTLKFGAKVTDENNLAITGELAEWIRETKTQDGKKPNLSAICDPSIPGIEMKNHNEEWFLTRPPLETPKMVFSANDQKLVKEALANFKKADDASNAITGVIEKKRDANNERTKALDILKEELSVAVGGGAMLSKPEFSKETAIGKDNLQKAHQLAQKEYGYNFTLSANPDQDIRDIKKKAGENQLDATLKNMGNEEDGWAKLEHTGGAAIQKCIQTILEKTIKPRQRNPLAKEIEDIKSITIQTAAGRVLFKATPTKSPTSP